MEAMVEEVTGVKVLSLHHDISTVSGEEVVISPLPAGPISARPRRNSLGRAEQGPHCVCEPTAYHEQG